MDALEILGNLLGGGSRGGTGSGGGGSLGGKILGELLKGATGGGSRPAPQPTPQPTRPGPRPSSHPVDIESEARSLEDLLGVATGNRSGSSQPAPSPSSYRPAPAPPRYQPQPPAPAPAPAPTRSAPQSQSMNSNDEAVILIRALINAAKADGRIDTAEQQAILSQVPNDPQTINFLKQEFAQPLDVREFSWSVPLGMEVKVYTMSLAGMQLDTNSEVQYLQELAHGLRLDPDLCQQIHARYGVQGVI
jgi:hypothetical protein